jgi:hypothetical protein
MMSGYFMELAARRKLGRGEDWKACRWEAMTGGAMIDGGVPRILKAGPRKGKPTWKGQPIERVLLNEEDCAREVQLYIAETGNCPVCRGTGHEWRGWSRDDGDRYRPCPRCKATGKEDKP